MSMHNTGTSGPIVKPGLVLTPRWRAAVLKLTGQCAYCLTDPASCPVAAKLNHHKAKHKHLAQWRAGFRPPLPLSVLRSLRSAAESIPAHDTAMFAARRPTGFDDDARLVRQHAWPPADREIKDAFAGMLELVDLIEDLNPGSCDASTVTGRAYQAALLVAKEHTSRRGRASGTPLVIAAGIVIEQVGKFIASRPARRWARWDERSYLRNTSTLLWLGGMSNYEIADKLGLDSRNLRREIENDLEEIEHIFGHFCKRNKGLRKKWKLPKIAETACYNTEDGDQSRDILAAAAMLATVDPDFDDVPVDDLGKILSSALFDKNPT
jgi:hypothetical protein